MDSLPSNKCTACQGENLVDGEIKGRLYFLPTKMFGGGYNMLAHACLDCGNVWYRLNEADREDLKAFARSKA